MGLFFPYWVIKVYYWIQVLVIMVLVYLTLSSTLHTCRAPHIGSQLWTYYWRSDETALIKCLSECLEFQTFTFCAVLCTSSMQFCVILCIFVQFCAVLCCASAVQVCVRFDQVCVVLCSTVQFCAVLWSSVTMLQISFVSKVSNSISHVRILFLPTVLQ